MKRFFLLIAAFFLSLPIFAFKAGDIKSYALENGLTVYLLEDFSSPTVRLELCVNAGFTSQSRENGGLFDLYARLSGGEISNDSVRFVKKVAPSSAEKAAIELSEKLKPLQPSDSELNAILSGMAMEFSEFEGSAAGFINSSIDSKIFPEKPWTRESGTSPKEFKSRSKEKVRSLLRDISDEYYIPANSQIFVSGNISEKSALTIIKKYFSDFTSRPFKNQTDEDSEKVLRALNGAEKAKAGDKPNGASTAQTSAAGSKRKFVLSHEEFSDEMTQIVLQYKSLDADESDSLSAMWNRDGSALKKLLLKQRNLKILGDEYIAVSSATEKSASRLIIQSLLGKAKVSPVVQAELFLAMSRDEDVFSKKELQSALKKSRTDFTRLSESSEETMEQFSRSIPLCHDGNVIQSFFEKNDRLSKISIESLQKKVVAEEPFVFVLVNDAVYQKYEGEFKKAGYERILQKESAWYNQDFYKNVLKIDLEKSDPNSKSTLVEEIAQSANKFISKNLAEFSSLTLKNGIPVTVKRSENSSSAVLSFTIAGGELLFVEKVPGLSAVLTDSIALNIQNQLDLFAQNGAINGFYEVTAETLSTHSIVTVTCLSSEIDFAIQAAYTALVYCDISPALADGVTYDERTQWRLKSGSGEFQLLCEAVRTLYAGSPYADLYNDTEDKPAEGLDFTKILENYPILLDSTRFSLILTGNLRENEWLQKKLDKTFGELGSIEATRSDDLILPPPDFEKLPSNEKKISVRHLFLTDISKDKAGPMPAVLVPTTKFLDPILYCFPSPVLSSPDCALFDSLLLEVASRLEKNLKKIDSDIKVKALLPENDLPFARLVVLNSPRTSVVESAYFDSVSALKNELSILISNHTENVIDLEKNDLLARLESNWLMRVISDAGSQTGTARLIQSGEIQRKPKLYLNQYSSVSSAREEDYFSILERFFPEKIPLKVYSKDTKK